MPISLTKGQNINLSKTSPTLVKSTLGLGWDARATDGQGFDLDASAFLLKADGKVRSDADFIFYNQRKSTDGSIEHMGDNRTGAGAGDDEQIKVNLAGVPADIIRIIFTVTIHEADIRRQSFGMVSNAFIRVVNDADKTEVCRYDLSEDHSTETALIFGELYRNQGDWKFKAVGQGYAGGLRALAIAHGVDVG